MKENNSKGQDFLSGACFLNIITYLNMHEVQMGRSGETEDVLFKAIDCIFVHCISSADFTPDRCD